MPRDIISEQQCNIEFVKMVEKYPCLYNYTLPAYSRKDISDKAWEDVAEATNMSPSACRERWRNLRAVFMRTIKKTVAGTKKKPYYLGEYMHFVVPYLQPTNMTEEDKQKMQNMDISRGKEANIAAPATETVLDDIKLEDLDNDTIQSSGSCQEWVIKPISSTRKRSLEIEEHHPPSNNDPPPLRSRHQLSCSIDGNDPVMSFINSLMPELRELNSTQFKCFKRRVLVLIDDITSEIPNVSHSESEYIT